MRVSVPVVVAALLAVPASGAAGKHDMAVRKGVAYTEEESPNDRRKLDLYLPDARSPEGGPDATRGASSLPIVLYVHGGGWFKGDRSRVHLKPRWLVEAGFVFASAGYRLVGDGGGHPANVRDLAAAIGWLRAHAVDFGGDPEAIFLMGHSTGAHLVSLVATDERHLERLGAAPADLAGVVALDTAAYDLVRLIRALDPGQRRLYYDALGRRPVSWRDASPLHHVAVGDTPPPFLLIDAGAPAHKTWQAQRFGAALQRAGGSARLERYPEETHGSITAELGSPGHSPSEAILRFLRAHAPTQWSAEPPN